MRRRVLAMVIGPMLDDGLIAGASVDSHYDSTTDVSATPRFGITQKGARYLRENSKMAEVARFLGSAFQSVLQVAVEAV